MASLINLASLIYMSAVTTAFLGIIGICRTVIYTKGFEATEYWYVSQIIFFTNYISGSFALPFMLTIMKRFYFKFIFFITAFANVINVLLFMLALNYVHNGLQAIFIIVSLLISPFISLYYCTFNYYIRSLANKNDGLLFGTAYSIFGMSTVLGAICIQFEEDLLSLNMKFYGPFLGVAFIISLLYWFIKEKVKSSESQPLSINLEEKLREHVFGQDSSLEEDEDLSYSTQFGILWRLPWTLQNFNLLVPNIYFMGMLGGFTLAFSSALLPTKDSQENLVNSILYHGIGQFMGGITAGVLSDLYGYIRILLLIQLVAIVSFIQAVLQSSYQLIIPFLDVELDSLYLNFSFQFCAGLAVSALEATTYAFYAQTYSESNQMLSFCNWNYCISFCISSLIFENSISHSKGKTQIIVFTIFMMVYAVLNAISIWTYRRKSLRS